MGEGVADWCVEHKREKPCSICEQFKPILRKIMNLSDEKRVALFGPAWDVPSD